MTRSSWFTALLLGLAGLLLAQSLELSRLARSAPIWVLVPTTGFLFLQLGLDVNSKLRRRLLVMRESLLGSAATVNAQPVSEGHQSSVLDRRPRELRLMVWIGFLISGIYLIGFLAGAMIFLLSYLKREAGLDWKRSLAVTAVTTVVIHLTFGLLVPVHLPRGVF